VAKAPAVKPLEREAPAVSARDRASAALDVLWAEQQTLDTPESRAALDRDIRGGGPDPLATQGPQDKDDDLEVAPRRRRRPRPDRLGGRAGPTDGSGARRGTSGSPGGC